MALHMGSNEQSTYSKCLLCKQIVSFYFKTKQGNAKANTFQNRYFEKRQRTLIGCCKSHDL